MKLPSLVKIPKYKRFEFRPRYYDPVKEELEERVEKIKREHNIDGKTDNTYRPTKIRFDRATKKNKFQINLQLYLIVFMLFDLFLLFKAENLSNQTWLIILILQVTALYLKVRFEKKKKLQ